MPRASPISDLAGLLGERAAPELVSSVLAPGARPGLWVLWNGAVETSSTQARRRKLARGSAIGTARCASCCECVWRCARAAGPGRVASRVRSQVWDAPLTAQAAARPRAAARPCMPGARELLQTELEEPKSFPNRKPDWRVLHIVPMRRVGTPGTFIPGSA